MKTFTNPARHSDALSGHSIVPTPIDFRLGAEVAPAANEDDVSTGHDEGNPLYVITAALAIFLAAAAAIIAFG